MSLLSDSVRPKPGTSEVFAARLDREGSGFNLLLWVAGESKVSSYSAPGAPAQLRILGFDVGLDKSIDVRLLLGRDFGSYHRSAHRWISTIECSPLPEPQVLCCHGWH